MKHNSRLAEMAVPLMVVGIVVVMILPLPTVVLDLFLAASIAISIVTLLTSMFVKNALDFSVFPALLLITTLFRLALNVSSARLILLDGFAGKVIESFGHVVVGGNLVVGLVIFLILVVIQFAVITAGAGRVSEVAARFTLDAMPGKQMAIDADLNSGLINEEQARLRRREVSLEAEFYGAMDGASKFVKGDAVAAVVIVVVNLLGGFMVGVMQQHMSIGDAIQRYALLSVGDGLVSQIPALLISIASGLVVTRATSEDDGGIGADVFNQLFRTRRVLGIAAAAVAAIALLPGLPKLPFLLLAGAMALLATRRPTVAQAAEQQAAAEAERLALASAGPAHVAAGGEAPDDVISQLRVEALELELATDLLDLVDNTRGGMLLERVRKLRRQIALDLGLVVPLVRTRDNALMNPSTYIIRVHGVEAGRGEAPPGCVLVLDDGFITDGMGGRPTTEPVFGLPAMWMPAELTDSLEASGATVVDRGSVLVTHLAEVVRSRAADLLSRQDVQTLLDALKEIAPALAGEIGPDGLSIVEVQKVLRGLLAESVPIRDLVAILEAVTAQARMTRDPESLLEAARQAIGPAICERLATDGTLAVVTLEPLLEQALLEAVTSGDAGSFLAIDPVRTEGLLHGITLAVNQAEASGRHPVLVCAQQLRPSIRRLANAARPDLPVLSYAELSRNLTIDPIGVVNLVQADAAI